MKILVLHHSKYGNGALIADAIAQGIRTCSIAVDVLNVTDVDVGSLSGYDAFIVGSPTHMAGPTFRSTIAIGRIGKFGAGRPFVAWATKAMDSVPTVKKLERKALRSGLQKIMDGRDFAVKDAQGPLVKGAIEEARSFGVDIGTRIGNMKQA